MTASKSQEDAQRWNERYSNLARHWFKDPRSILMDHLDSIPTSGLALDAAMGTGANADLLIRHGLKVVGVDISRIALREALSRNNNIQAVLADLRQIPFKPDTFDVIVNLYFLDRSVCSRYMELLKPGGLIVFETLTQAMLEKYPDKNPTHLLNKGELALLFPGFDILYYNEGWIKSDHGETKAVSSLLAVRPE